VAVFDRVVVALDGSEIGEAALPKAVELAAAVGAPLHLVRIVDLGRLEQYGSFGLALDTSALDLALEDERAAARDYLAATQARLHGSVMTVTIESREGLAARELVAALRPNDVLVMASHGRTGLQRWFLGSVAEEVVRHAPSPVMLIRSGEQHG
jgi:nucleotide-binding universal stress UspA family protein